MNFDEAINSHTKWKVRLRMVVEGSEKLDPAVVGLDNQCSLGKWIYGEVAQFSSLASYDALKAEHARFHQCAAVIIAKVNAGDRAAAESLLGPVGDFSRSSQATVAAIMKMKREAV